MVAADRLQLHREHIAGYGFLFATPSIWLLDSMRFRNVHNGWLTPLLGYVLVLWIPAVLYSGCLWLLLAGLKAVAARRPR